MKPLLTVLVVATLLSLSTSAQSLYFSSGSVSDYHDVNLSLIGPSNLVCQVERLNHTDDTWEVQGTVALDSTGTGTFDSSLIQGIYGFFRAQSTNGTYRSTNAYGAVAGYLNQTGYTMIGNPFGERTISEAIPDAPEFSNAYKWRNSSQNYLISTMFLGSWDTNMAISGLEGLIVLLPSSNTNDVRYFFDGLFTTNAMTKLLPTGLELICSQLYGPQITNTFTVDILDSNDVDGVSQIPVETPGYDPQATIYQAADSSLNYITNILTSNNVWQSAGTNTTVYINLTEGFWIDKPTNATWSASRPIW